MARLSFNKILCALGFHKWEDVDLPAGTVYPHGRRICSRCGRTERLHKTLDGYQEWRLERKHW